MADQQPTYILGISAFYHDSAACLIKDGEIIAAAQEERFSRIKHDSGFPTNAMRYCVSEARINSGLISSIVFYEKPLIKFERLIETYLAFAPRGFTSFSKAMPLWIKDKLFQKRILIQELQNSFGSSIDWGQRLLFSEHHLSHAASAFFPSPFSSAAVLTLDGVGEWTTTSLAIGSDNNLEISRELHFPHSLGLLYSAFTHYTGFKVNSGEYKVMGLAPYGVPKYSKLIKDHLVDICDDGTFQLNMEYFDFATGLTMTSKKFHQLFGGNPRKPESPLTQKDMDLAASIQCVTEEIMLKLCRSVKQATGEKNLCLAGGVALNCVANGILARERIFDQIWIQPAAGDAGGALGAAMAAWHLHFEKPRHRSRQDQMKGSYLGPKWDDHDIEQQLKHYGAKFTRLDNDRMLEVVAKKLSDGNAVGWMQGRMEFGPRALGSRSILADPRPQVTQKTLNLKVKYRESFRPFAPSVLKEDAPDWFDIDTESPYMLLTASVKENLRIPMTESQKSLFGIEKLNIKRSKIPAVTHVDYSARIQTVDAEQNPKFHALIQKFKALTGCPVLVNTSFNVRGEPIVHSPLDAFRCFMGTGLDVLVIENFVLFKEDQDQSLAEQYATDYELD